MTTTKNLKKIFGEFSEMKFLYLDTLSGKKIDFELSTVLR